MVTFTCAHCGESVKKPVVSKHYERKCHGRLPNLTCVDCLKDFRGNEYEAHTKCISESERYGAKGSVQPNSINKGEQKQQLWSECIQKILDSNTLRDDERRLISLLVKHENVPRKKAKFQNFLNSAYKSCRFSNDLIERVWVQMEKVFKETKETSNNNGNNKQGNIEANGTPTEEQNGQSEPKKRKHEEENQTNQDNPTSTGDEPEIKKSKKSKKKKKENDPDQAQGDNQVENNVNNGVGPSQTEPNKKKGKKKKNKNMETADEIKETPEEPTPLVNGKEKKRKNKISESEDKTEEKPEEATPLVNGEGKNKKKKKRKTEESVEGQETINDKENLNQTETNVDSTPVFSWVDTIQSVLSKKNLEEEISIKKVEKKVLKRYSKTTGNEITQKASRKFFKKLKKIPNVTVNGEYVVLHKSENSSG